MGDEDMAVALFDFLLQMTSEMDSKILLLEFIHRTFGQNNTILHLAAYLGFTHLVQKLIESGASVYVRNGNNYKRIFIILLINSYRFS
jgi:ankyrin repeat protein